MPTSATPPSSELSFFQALESRRAHLEALDLKELRSVRLNPRVLQLRAIGAAHRLERFRDALIAQFGDSAAELLDSLVPAARAVAEADARLRGTPKRRNIKPIHAALVAKHTLLLADARSLVARGLLPAEVVRRAGDARGYRSAVRSVMLLDSVFRRHWAQIEHVTPTTRADLQTAGRLVAELAEAAATDGPTPERAAAADLRRRAIADAVRIYDQLRRQMTYLRWHEDDVDTLVPSLFAGRGGRKKRRKDEPAEL